MKLTFLISSLSGGGAERVASLLVNRWADVDKWDVTLNTIMGREVDPSYKISPDVKYIPLGLGSVSQSPLQALRSNFSRARQLRRAVLSQKPDVVVSFGETTNCLTLLALMGTKTPTVISERVDPRFHKIPRFWALVRRALYRYSDRLVVQTKTVQDYFQKSMGVPSVVIENPGSPVPSAIRTSPERIVMGAGRLASQKGFDLLITAFSKVHSKHPDWKLAIYGEGPAGEALRAQIRELGLDSAAKLCGFAPDITEAYRRAGMFVLSSRYEGFPNVLCEAMAMGLPVISFDCQSGPRDIITNGENGILVKDGDVDELARAIGTLIEFPELRQRMEQSAKLIADRLSPDRVCTKWRALLVSLVEKR